MKELKSILIQGLLIGLPLTTAIAQENDKKCMGSPEQQNALDRRRDASEVLEYRKDVARLAANMDLARLANDPSLSEEERAKVRSWLAQLSNINPDASDLKRMTDEITQLLNRTRAAAGQECSANAPFGDKDVEIQVEMRGLTAEQRALLMKDPKTFWELLDFTATDPDLNRDFLIRPLGADIQFSPNLVGRSFNPAKLIAPNTRFDGGNK